MEQDGTFECTITPDRIVYYTIVGALSVDTAARLNDVIYETAAQIEGPLRLLADVSQADPASAHARRYLMQILRHPRLERLAVVGASTVLQALVMAAIHLTQSEDRIALFQRSDEARAWLKSTPVEC